MTKRYLVYVLSDQGVPFYVGKASTKHRPYNHEKFAKSDNLRDLGFKTEHDYNPHKTNKIKKLLREGRQVEYSFFHFDSEKDAFQEETRLISLYGRIRHDAGGILTNITLGGVGGDLLSNLNHEHARSIIDRRTQTNKDKTPAEKSEIKRKSRASLEARSDEEKAETKRRRQIAQRHYWVTAAPEKLIARNKKISQALAGKSKGPSPKKGKPATGSNAKGVRINWCRGVSFYDPRRKGHRDGMMRKLAARPNDGQWDGAVPFKLFGPKGEIVEGNNLRWLSRTYGVSTRIRYVIRGDKISMNGWSLTKPKTWREALTSLRERFHVELGN